MADILSNSKARRDYQVLETLEAGIVLRGTEVKSLRAGLGQLSGAFARVEGGEVFVHGLHIDEYTQGNRYNHNPKAVRKLLLHKAEARRLADLAQAKGHALIPLTLYWRNRRVKVALGVCRGKQEFDKRAALKEREAGREVKRVLLHRLKRGLAGVGAPRD